MESSENILHSLKTNDNTNIFFFTTLTKRNIKMSNKLSEELNHLCLKSLREKGSEESFNAIQKWLHENKGKLLLVESNAIFKDENCTTALHYLACVKPPKKIIQDILELFPDEVRIIDRFFTLLPLQISCKFDASVDVVKMLLQAYPNAIEIKDKNWMIAIHYACCYGSSSAVAKTLLREYPEGAKLKDLNGMLPFHFACVNKTASYETLKLLVAIYPECVTEKAAQDRTPLELLKESGIAERRDCNGMLLLHHACSDGACYELLQLFVDAYPKGCATADNQGRLPWFLLKRNEAASTSDKNGTFLLHRACLHGASLHLLKLLLDAYPECITKLDENKKTPSQLLKIKITENPTNKSKILLLHRTCSREFCNQGSVKALETLMRLLVEACPDSVNEKDDKGMIPLHCACARADSAEVLKCLVPLLVCDFTVSFEQRICIVNAKDSCGRTPLHILMNRTVPECQDSSGLPGTDVVSFIVSSGIVEYLVGLGTDVYANDEANNTPLSYAENLLAERNNKTKHRLQLYLQMKPYPNYIFFCVLLSLSKYEQKEAVLHRYVQEKLDEVVGRRFATSIHMVDLYFSIIVIICNGIAVSRYNKYLYFSDTGICKDGQIPNYSNCNCMFSNFLVYPAIVLCGGVYFSIREIMKFVTLTSYGYHKIWWTHYAKLLDVLFIFIMYFLAIVMLTGIIHPNSTDAAKETFRSLSSVLSGVLFLLVFFPLQRIFYDFASFGRGVTVVAKPLLSFLAALCIIISSFAFMFFALISTECGQCLYFGEPCSKFCTYGGSYFEVYNMVFGNYSADDIYMYMDWGNSMRWVVMFLYFMLGVAVVIVLFNVLVAIVVDAYSAVKQTDSEEVFWSNRLAFVTEVEVLSSWFKKAHCKLCTFDFKSTADDLMKWIPYFFACNNVYGTLSFLVNALFEGTWMLLGFVTAGLLCPPRVRSQFWNVGSHKKTSNEDSSSEANMKLIATMMESMKAETAQLKTELLAEVRQMLTVAENRIKSDNENVMNQIRIEIAEAYKGT